MDFLIAIQGLLAIAVCFLILIQQRAAGLTATFGGVNTVQVQRRGAEKVLYQLTIACSVALILLSIVQWYIV